MLVVDASVIAPAIADGGPDGLGSAVFRDLVAQGRLDRSDRFLLRLFAAFLALQPDQHVVLGAEFLKRDLAQAEPVQGRAHGGKVHRAVGLHLQEDAAQEIDAQVQALDREKAKRRDHQRDRKCERDDPAADEVDRGRRRDKA